MLGKSVKGKNSTVPCKTASNKRIQRRPRSKSRINLSTPLAAPLIRAVRRTWRLSKFKVYYL